ncbi:MAG: ornithine carbamoyltransferase [Sulfobacillus thermosulfidooxidans]|uniref:Ornithine carbamoyltransferase n=1 Tax=Sulfobacillus thermosulfidooxidans TaxID=28034 RepID=A0A2T2X1W6_SULTH|nr:MAG: ornithine carbamoyltransferase [Sulfobacillus thermosulfidooxidans]
MVERLLAKEARLQGRSVVSLKDWSPSEIKQVLMTAKWMKTNPKVAEIQYALKGKSVAMIFELPSTRTRVSFQVAIQALGAAPVILDWQDSQLGRGEPIEDTARVLSRYVDGMIVRAKSHQMVQALQKWATVPVFNALTDMAHPFQVLADALTIWEYVGYLSGAKMAYVGDGNNMANSYMIIGAKLGMHVNIACPEAWQPSADIIAYAQQEAEMTGGSIQVMTDPVQAVHGVDVVATDVFVSMGDVDSASKRQALAPYQVNAALMQHAKENAIFLHCLPAHRGEEVTEEVLEGPQSVVFDEAENRLHVQKSVLYHTLAEF